jgi:uncharacterized membrane protein YkvA (DUF1232 family)
MFAKLKAWAKQFKSHIFVLYLAYRDDRTPWFAKLFSVCVVAYAFSPIDLIPDFIPILGYLDDVILIPLGVMLALKMLPELVIMECRVKAEELMKKGKPKNWFVGSLIVLIWILALGWIFLIAYRYLSS